jgi:hypothetical protein
MKPAGPDNQNIARIYEAAAYRPATHHSTHGGMVTECTPIIILQIMSFDVVLLSSTYPAVEAK